MRANGHVPVSPDGKGPRCSTGKNANPCGRALCGHSSLQIPTETGRISLGNTSLTEHRPHLACPVLHVSHGRLREMRGKGERCRFRAGHPEEVECAGAFPLTGRRG